MNRLQVFNYSVGTPLNREVKIYIDGDIVDASTQSFYQALFDDMTTTSYRSFRETVNKIKNEVDTFLIYINSYGGLVTEALAIYDFIQELKNEGKTIKTIGRGIIASAATMLLLSVDEPSMSENSTLMIHLVSGGIYGTVVQIENYAKAMRKYNDLIVSIYAKKTDKPTEEIEALMTAETYFTAKEAKDNKFISTIEGFQEFSNAISPDDWPYQNKTILNLYNRSVKNDVVLKEIEMKQFLANLSQQILNAIKGVKTEGMTNEQLINSVGTCISTAFEASGAEFENTVNAAITNVTSALETRLKAMEDAKYPTNEQFTSVQDELKGLAGDILTLKGGPSNGGKGNENEQPIGGFN